MEREGLEARSESADCDSVGAIRVRRRLAKWEHGRTPEDGPPDEELDAVFWFDAEGNEITDPVRIMRLEATWHRQRREGNDAADEHGLGGDR